MIGKHIVIATINQSVLLLSLRFVMIMWWRLGSSLARVTDKWFRSSRHSPLFCLPRSIFSLFSALFFSADTHGQEIFSIFHGNQPTEREGAHKKPGLMFLCHRNDNNLLIIHPLSLFRFFASRFSIFFGVCGGGRKRG
jgi:hypothetical protein